jgi:hypothetical protein
MWLESLERYRRVAHYPGILRPDCYFYADGTENLPKLLHLHVISFHKNAGKKPGDIVIGGIDLAPATITGLKDGYITAALDQQLYLQGFLPVIQIVLTKKYGFAGLTTNTGAGVVTPKTIGALEALIKAGIR